MIDRSRLLFAGWMLLVAVTSGCGGSGPSGTAIDGASPEAIADMEARAEAKAAADKAIEEAARNASR